MSMLPVGYTWLTILKVATYSLFLVGALTPPHKIQISIALLLLGITSRSYLELKTSVLKVWFLSEAGFDGGGALLLGLFYTTSFVIPFLLLFDAFRLFKATQQEENKATSA